MRLETFFEKFETLAEMPAAVGKLRELIVQRAISGNLVPNDPTEAPVTLELSGDSTRSPKRPMNWRHGKVRDAFAFEYGDNLPAPKRSETGEYPVYGSNGIVGTHEKYLTKEPAIIVGRKGSAGALNIATGPSWTTDVAYYVRPPNEIDLQFTYYLFSTLRLDQLGKGIKPGLSRSEAYELPIAVPPLAEQRRIVAKVQELMALCDRLEAQQHERETRHTALARAALARFADAPTPANLQFLFHPSYTITPADLRKSILTLAVQGKLVPQDSGDEPVEQLLQRSLGGTKKINRTKSERLEGPSSGQALGYLIPETWRWVRLDELLVFGPTNGISPKPVDYETSVRSLTLSATTQGHFRAEHFKFIASTIPESSDLWLEDGDILVQRGNTIDYVGVAAIYRGASNLFVYPDLMMKLRLSSACDVNFIHFAMSQDAARKFLRTRASGTSGSMPKINQSTLKSLPLPIPPLAEQRRISIKLVQLMGLIDNLEGQFVSARARGGELVEKLISGV